MNVTLLREIETTILAEPDRFRMDQFSCGTAHCIAGHALGKMGIPVPVGEGPKVLPDGRFVWDVAAQLLDIDNSDAFDTCQAERLFIAEIWPREFFMRYFETRDRRERAQIAADRIERFIESGGDE